LSCKKTYQCFSNKTGPLSSLAIYFITRKPFVQFYTIQFQRKPPQVTTLLYSLQSHKTKLKIRQDRQFIIFALELENNITLVKLCPVSPSPQEEEVTMC